MASRRLSVGCAALAVWLLTSVPASACAARPMEQDGPPLVLAATPGPVVLRPGATDAQLQVARGERDVTPGVSLSARLREAVPGRQVYLTFAGAAVQAAPGVTYNVYLNRPAGDTAEGTSSAYYLGALSFFNAGRTPGREITLNVTAPLERLLARGALETDVRVSIVPAGAPEPAAAPRIETIRLVAR